MGGPVNTVLVTILPTLQRYISPIVIVLSQVFIGCFFALCGAGCYCDITINRGSHRLFIK